MVFEADDDDEDAATDRREGDLGDLRRAGEVRGSLSVKNVQLSVAPSLSGPGESGLAFAYHSLPL